MVLVKYGRCLPLLAELNRMRTAYPSLNTVLAFVAYGLLGRCLCFPNASSCEAAACEARKIRMRIAAPPWPSRCKGDEAAGNQITTLALAFGLSTERLAEVGACGGDRCGASV